MADRDRCVHLLPPTLDGASTHGDWFTEFRHILTTKYQSAHGSMLDHDIILPDVDTMVPHFPTFLEACSVYPGGKEAFFKERQRRWAHLWLDLLPLLLPRLSSTQRLLLIDLESAQSPGSKETHQLKRARLAADEKRVVHVSLCMATPNYRPGIDVSFPAVLPAALGSREQRHIPIEQRRVLLSFKGRMTHGVRLALVALDNGADIVCIDSSAEVASKRASHARGAFAPRDEDAVSLHARSKFALCPRGDAPYSFRMVEALSCGAIPVILGDTWVLPFSEVLDYRSFAICVREDPAEIAALPATLRALSAARVAAYQQAGQRAFEGHFFPMDRTIATLLAIVRIRTEAEGARPSAASQARERISYQTADGLADHAPLRSKALSSRPETLPLYHAHVAEAMAAHMAEDGRRGEASGEAIGEASGEVAPTIARARLRVEPCSARHSRERSAFRRRGEAASQSADRSARHAFGAVLDVSDAAPVSDVALVSDAAPVSDVAPATPAPVSDVAPAKPALPAGQFRWIVDISGWEPGPAEWALLLKMLPEEDSTKVMRFKFVADQKRALVSRYLQRRACFEATGVPWKAVEIARTKGSKPFMKNKPKPPTAPGLHANWNFNVSHEGKFVALAAEPRMVCGVDVAAPEDHRKGAGAKKRDVLESLTMMKDQLSPSEWKVIEDAKPNEHKMEEAFRKFWSLKEAYTKGRGDGLGFEFKRCDFALGAMLKGASDQPVQRASVVVDRKQMPQWGFYVQGLEADHWVSAARGPPSDIVDANGTFTATFGERKISSIDVREQLDLAEPAFTYRTIDELVANDMRDALKQSRS